MGPVPRLPRYCGRLRLLNAHPSGLRSLHPEVPLQRSSFAPTGGEARPPRAWGLASPDPPCRVSLRGGVQISQVPGAPSCPCHALRPRRSPGARSLLRLGAAFRLWNDVGLRYLSDFRGCIARPTHSLSTLRVHGHPWPRKTRFRLVTSLGRAGLPTRRVPLRGFLDAVGYVITSPSARLVLAHSRHLNLGNPGTHNRVNSCHKPSRDSVPEWPSHSRFAQGFHCGTTGVVPKSSVKGWPIGNLSVSALCWMGSISRSIRSETLGSELADGPANAPAGFFTFIINAIVGLPIPPRTIFL